MPDLSQRCRGTTNSGEPCKQRAGASGYCHLHDPEKVAQREAEYERAMETLQQEKEKKDRLLEDQKEKYGLVQKAIETLETELELCKQGERQHNLLTSACEGLYVEIDKLTRKAPADEITDLALEQINTVIKDTKDLMKDDPYIQRLVVFIPAGNMPQHRDALLVLSQVKKGLERFSRERIQIVNGRISEARIIETALKQLIRGKDEAATLKEVERELGYSSTRRLPAVWVKERGSGYQHERVFNFDLLNSINIEEYLDIT